MLLATAGCAPDGKVDEVATNSSASSDGRPGQVDLRQLVVESDLRRHDAALASAFLRGDDLHRAAAARGLSRIGSTEALVLLQRGLSDPSPDVRREVSFGLGLGELPLDAWLGAYASERDPRTHAAMTQDLGGVLDPRRAGPLLRAIHSDPPAAACAGIASYAARDPDLSPSLIRDLQRLVVNPDPATASPCLQALQHVKPEALRAASPGLGEQLALGLRHTDWRVRLAWLRLASRITDAARAAVLGATRDPHPVVAIAAFQELARSGPRAMADVTAAFDALWAQRADATTSYPVLHAALDVVPALGDSAELVQWLGTVVDRTASAQAPVGAARPTDPQATENAALHCAATRAFDRVRKWPARSLDCGAGLRPRWVGEMAAVEVLASATGSDALREVQLRKLFTSGDWHVRRAVAQALTTLAPPHAITLLIEGISHDHPLVRSAAVESLAELAPRLREPGQPLPQSLLEPLRAAFNEFHVKDHVEGLRAWLAVVRMTRLRSELGPATLLARSGISAVRKDALALLDEWGHPAPTGTPEQPPLPLSREQLSDSPTTVSLQLPTGAARLILQPGLAPATVARLTDWLSRHAKLEVREVRHGRHVLLGDAEGTTPPPWRSEESPQPLERGSVVIPQTDRDVIHASLLILLAPAPELERQVTVVGRIDPADVDQLAQLHLADAVVALTTR